MTDVSAQQLRDEASEAHRRGDTDAAIALFDTILDLFPDTREAVDAMFYLSSIGKGRRRPAKATDGEKKNVQAKRLSKGREA